jgi:hypothetical protein
MQNPNPLASHFRQPAVYLKLPSGGRYWTNNSLNLPANGEVGIMPMTAKDEIMLRTPDALMNGQSIIDVIQSCCPNIVDAWGMPTIDVDAILIAIRIATYGNEMDIDSKCQHCDHDNRHKLELGSILLKIKSPDYNQVLVIDGLKIKFKPMNYMQSNKNNIINFEEQKLIQVITNDSLDEQTRKSQFDMHLQRIIDSNIKMLTMGTESITTDTGEIVTEPHYIAEFYNNATNKIIKAVQGKLREIAEVSNLPPARVQCEACEKEYNVGVTFDYANFFEPLS